MDKLKPILTHKFWILTGVTLVVAVGPAQEEKAGAVLAGFGRPRAAKAGSVAIGIDGGASALSGALRALEDAGIDVEHVELDAPSLDDVFADATGRRLEGAEEGGAAPGAVER